VLKIGRSVNVHRAVDKRRAVVDYVRPVAQAYAYELRRGEEVLSTGWLTAEHEVTPGDEIALAGIVARVDEVAWADGQPRLRLKPVQATT
jgi:hypothetical protein